MIDTRAAELRRVQLELGQVRLDVNALDAATPNTSSSTTTTTTTSTPPIINLIRNGDHSHSQGTWFLATSSGDDNAECANVFTHVKDTAVKVTDGAMTSGSAVLTCATSAPFVAGDVGKRVIVYGAGTAGGNLVTTVSAYTSATQVTLAANASTTVAAATVRFRLQKLTKTTNLTSPAAATTDVLKDPSHSKFGAAIQDPQWDKTNGSVKLGSTNTVSYPFGYYKYVQGGGAGNGTDFVALHPLFPARPIVVRINAARASTYVKPNGYLNFGIFNNDDNALEYAKGANFTISGTVTGTPSATNTAYYYLVIETDQGYSITSQVATVLNAPTTAAFTPSCFVALSWTRYAGAIRQKVYRRLGAGNVFLLETIESGANSYIDTNPAGRTDVGATFPNPANGRDGITSLVATSTTDLQDLPVNGVGTWRSIQAEIPFPSTVDLSKFSDPHVRIGLSAACDLYLTDVVTNSTSTITSAAAQFIASHAGKAYTLTDGTNTKTGTISTFTNSTTIVLDSAVSWTGTGNKLTITGGAPNGILFDLCGVSMQSGEWSPHAEDFNNRPQTVASNPNGSTQGSTTGGGTSSGGGGIVVTCMLWNTLISISPTETIEAINLKKGMKVFDGEGFNIVEEVYIHEADEVYFFNTDFGSIGVTPSHRFVCGQDSVKYGVAASEADKLLYFDGESFIITEAAQGAAKGNFTVVSLRLSGNHLFLANGFLSHNSKDPNV